MNSIPFFTVSNIPDTRDNGKVRLGGACIDVAVPVLRVRQSAYSGVSGACLAVARQANRVAEPCKPALGRSADTRNIMSGSYAQPHGDVAKVLM
jgi:hypothetical protein